MKRTTTISRGDSEEADEVSSLSLSSSELGELIYKQKRKKSDV